MQVHVFVRVGVVEGEAGRRESRELRADFRGELRPDARAEEVIQPQPDLVGGKPASVIDEIRNARSRQHGRTLDDHEMQADAQGWQRAGAAHRILSGRPRHHQARGGQHALAMRALHPLVDRLGEAEIVGGQDDADR